MIQDKHRYKHCFRSFVEFEQIISGSFKLSNFIDKLISKIAQDFPQKAIAISNNVE